MKSLFASILLLMALLAPAGCKTGEKPATTAVINTRDVLTKCDAGIRVSREIQNQFSGRRDELARQEEAIHKLQVSDELADPKSGKKAELQRMVAAFVEARDQLHRDVAGEEAVKFKPVADKVNKVLAAYAKEHGIVSVQDRSGLVYIDPSIDITDPIIKLVDQDK